MADYRRPYDEEPRRHERDWADRSGDEDRGSHWEAPREDREFGHYAASTGAYRTDDRSYHNRYRAERMRDEGPAYGRSRFDRRPDAADEYYRAAREQRDDYLRWEARSPGAEFEEHTGGAIEHPTPWSRRERGGYWRNYEPQGTYAGRGPKDYQRSDERVREEICDCMTDDPMLDASEITVVVNNGEVTLGGTVTSRDQKRRAEDVAERVSGVKDVTNQLRVSREANGHSHTAAPHVSQASGNGTPSKSTSRNTT